MKRRFIFDPRNRFCRCHSTASAEQRGFWVPLIRCRLYARRCVQVDIAVFGISVPFSGGQSAPTLALILLEHAKCFATRTKARLQHVLILLLFLQLLKDVFSGVASRTV